MTSTERILRQVRYRPLVLSLAITAVSFIAHCGGGVSSSSGRSAGASEGTGGTYATGGTSQSGGIAGSASDGGSDGGLGGTAGSGGAAGAGGTAGAAGTAGTGSTHPCGIFINDAVRDYPFVAGTLVTLKWPEMESTPSSYDFSKVTTLHTNLSPGQTIAIRMTRIEPEHIVAGADEVWTWTDPNPNHTDCTSGCPRPVPWDVPTLNRYRELVGALAGVQVDSDQGPLPLGQHPDLESVMLLLPGWSRIREIGFEISELPGYSRPKLIDATLEALRIQVEAFPGKPVFVGFWKVTDDVETPALWEAMRTAILDDPALDKIGFYQENLSHYVQEGEDVFQPTTTFAAPLALSQQETFNGFQALTSWSNPSPSYAAKVEGGSPVAAIEWARSTYGARYFEIYTSDADAAASGAGPAWLSGFEALAENLCLP